MLVKRKKRKKEYSLNYLNKRIIIPIVLGLQVISCSCSKSEPFPFDPLEKAKTIDLKEAEALLLDKRLSSVQRGRVAIILGARFKEKVFPIFEKVLKLYPINRWPDRFMLVKGLRASGEKAIPFALRILEFKDDEASRMEALKFIARYRKKKNVLNAIKRIALHDPSLYLRKKAKEIINKN